MKNRKNENTFAWDIFSNYGQKVLFKFFDNMRLKNLKLLLKSKDEKYLFLVSIPLTIYSFIYPIDSILNVSSLLYLTAPVGYFYYKALYQIGKQYYFKYKYRKLYESFEGKVFVIDIKNSVEIDLKYVWQVFLGKLDSIESIFERVIKHIKNEMNNPLRLVFNNVITDIKKFINTKNKRIKTDMTYIVYSFLTTKELWERSSDIEKSLKTTVIDIKQIARQTYLIDTKKINWKDYVRREKSNQIKLIYTFKRCGFYLTRLNVNSSKYQDVYTFDCDVKPKEIYNNIDYMKHITKINFIIKSGLKRDYELIINKKVENPSFFDSLKEVELNKKENLLLGYSKQGKEVLINIFAIYHSIVAGSTGKGKSNFGHVFLSSLIKSGFDMVFLLLDTKKSELKRYRDISNVVYQGENEKCVRLLEHVLIELERRNAMFEHDKFIKDIETYNLKNPNDKLPYIVIYIEEISDLLLSSNANLVERFTNVIERLTQIGRSGGYRIILSTQYPKAEVITTLIKSNCATRFGFGTTNITGSQLITDNEICKGLPKGVMYYQNGGEETKIYVPHLEDKHVENIVYYLENLDKKTQKGLSEKFISFIPDELIARVSTLPQENFCGTYGIPQEKNIKIEINDKKDLLKLYKKICLDKNEPILSISKTEDIVNIKKTKIQELRSELTKDGYFENKNKKLYWKVENKEKILN